MKENYISRDLALKLLNKRINQIGVPSYTGTYEGGIVRGLLDACETLKIMGTAYKREVEQKEVDNLSKWVSENIDCDDCKLCKECRYHDCQKHISDAILQIMRDGELYVEE